MYVAFGPFGADKTIWYEAPGDFSTGIACCGITRMRVRTREVGLLIIAGRDGYAQLVTCDATQRLELDRTIGVGLDPGDIRFGDLNGDELLDIVVANRSRGTFTVLAGNGDGSFTRLGAYAAGPDVEALIVARVDGDDLDDVLVGNANPGLSVALNLSAVR